MLKSTVTQLAWYIERDGARVVRYHPDGSQTVEVPALGGHITYWVPAHYVDDLNVERDRAYKVLADRRRAAANR